MKTGGHVRLYTDDRSRLTLTVGPRDGIQTAALDDGRGRDAGFDIGD